MIKKIIIILSLSTISVSVLLGQESYKLSGNIINADTKEPLAFSTISIAGTNAGVVTNFEGAFEISIPATYKGDSLLVSMLGFKPKKLAINSQLNTSNATIALEENILMLQEVEVNERKLTALDIVSKVIDNIPNNYPTKPYLLEGFTRSHKHECGKYVTLFEAAFELYGMGYHKKSPEKIYIKESRQSQHTPYYHSRVLRNNRNLFISMNHINDVLFRGFSLKLKYNKYEIDKYLVDNDELIYVIKTNHSEHVTHTLHINANDFALMKVNMEMGTPEGSEWNPLMNKGPSSDSLEFKVTRISKTVQFAKKGDTYFSKYMDWLVEGKLYSTETKNEFCDWGFRFENMFNNAVFEDVQKPSNALLMNPRSKKDPTSTPYNSEFWSNYAPIVEFPITPQIVIDLEVNGPIEKQFQQSSKQP
ncbi:carboxypeptidase-like regulatory domain-containing protein [Ekhidna sp.]